MIVCVSVLVVLKGTLQVHVAVVGVLVVNVMVLDNTRRTVTELPVVKLVEAVVVDDIQV